MYLLCIGASRGFAFVEFNATQEAARWMEMKQVERSYGPDTQPMRCCTRATDCPVAARHGNAVLWPSPWPRLCTYQKAISIYRTLIIYLGIPTYFCRLLLTLALAIYTHSRDIMSLLYTHTVQITTRRDARGAFTCPLSIIKSSWTNNDNRRRVIPVRVCLH